MTRSYFFGGSRALFRRALLGEPSSATMTGMKKQEKTALPLHDYDTALRNAVSWLGDNYLLAVPAQRRNEEHRPYFSAPRRWISATRAPIRTRH